MARPLSWAEKYRPRTLAQVVGNEKAKEKFVSWLKSWRRGAPRKKAALLYGPPGCGKTTLVYAAANDLGYEVVEANASDVRTSEALRRRIERAAREGSLFGSLGKILLLDEVDGLSAREDVGGLDTILEIVSVARHPVVMTANNPWDPSLRPLREVSLMIEVRPLRLYEMVRVLTAICSKEGVKADPEALKEIARRARGDLRAAINDLQAVAEGKRYVTLKDVQVLAQRAKQYDMFEITRRVLTAKTIEQARSVLGLPSLDYELLMQFIHENIPYQYDSVEAIAEAYDALSRADMFMGRIKRTQNWSLLPYALELMTAGVAVIRSKPKFRWVKYSFPRRLSLMARSRAARAVRGSILAAIAKKCHVSKAVANLEILPYIAFIYEHDRERGRRILKWLGVSERSFQSVVAKRGSP